MVKSRDWVARLWSKKPSVRQARYLGALLLWICSFREARASRRPLWGGAEIETALQSDYISACLLCCRATRIDPLGGRSMYTVCTDAGI